MRHRKVYSLTILSILTFLLLEKPAVADAGTFWGFYGTNTPILLGLPIKGIALIVVILLEMAAFARIWRMSWLNALKISFVLNLISSIVGVIVGLLYLYGPECGYMLIIIFLGILIAAATVKYLPWWLTLVGCLSIVIGSFAAGHNIVIYEPFSHWGLLAALILPLMAGFGFTLFAEGWGTKFFTITTNKWRGLMWANIASYIFLAVMVIVVGPNPYHNAVNLEMPIFFSHSFSESARGSSAFDARLTVEEMTKILHGRRVSNLVMLGLKKDTPVRNYDALYDIDLLNSSYAHSSYTDPKYGFAIIEDTSKSTELTPNAREKLEWYRIYLTFFAQAVEAIKIHDQNALNIVYLGWKLWWDKNPLPYNSTDKEQGHLDYELGAPEEPIKNAIEFFNSDLRIPTSDNINKSPGGS